MTMTMAQKVNTFERSLARCLDAGDFMGAFYETFVSSSDAVREKFARTDLEKQKQVLAKSLYLMARASLGTEEGLEHLETIARTHSRRHLDIAPSLYDHWCDTLISTAQKFDHEFSPQIEAAWRELLGRGIARMVEVYRNEHTVRPSR
jgi:hemoglobin-like flavoprotein